MIGVSAKIPIYEKCLLGVRGWMIALVLALSLVKHADDTWSILLTATHRAKASIQTSC